MQILVKKNLIHLNTNKRSGWAGIPKQLNFEHELTHKTKHGLNYDKKTITMEHDYELEQLKTNLINMNDADIKDGEDLAMT